MHPKTSALYASTSAPNHMPFSWPFGTQRLIPQSHLVDSLFSHLVTQVIYTFPFNIDFSVHSVSLYLNHLAPGCSFIQHLFDSFHTRQIYAASCFEVPLLSYFLSLQSCLTRHLFLSYSYTGSFTIIQLALSYRHFSYSSRSAILMDSRPLSASPFIVIRSHLSNSSMWCLLGHLTLIATKISRYAILYTLHQRPFSDAFSAIYSIITLGDSSLAVFSPTISINRFLHGNLSHILRQLLRGSIP